MTGGTLLEGLCELRRGMVLTAVRLLEGLAGWVLLEPKWL